MGVLYLFWGLDGIVFPMRESSGAPRWVWRLREAREEYSTATEAPFPVWVGVGARRELCAEAPKGHAPEHSERVVAFPDSCTKYTIFIIFLYVGRIGRLPPSPPRGVAILAIVGFCCPPALPERYTCFGV